MKGTVKRLLAMFLCLTMVLTLLPTTVLAAVVEDQVQDAQTQSDADEGVSPQADAIYPDGAVEDEWKLDPQTIQDSSTDLCTKTSDGHLRMKITSAYSNNGDQWTAANSGSSTPGPAVFISDTMKGALKAEDGVYTVSFKMKPLVDGMCFGVYFNYKDPAHGAFIGYNTANGSGSWFWQKYGGGNAYGDCLSSAPSSLAANTTYDVVASWNPTAKTATLSIDGKDVMKDWDYSAISDADGIGVINNIGIKLGKSNQGVLSEIEVWDIHYSGQEPITSYTVSGTVKDADGNAVEGVAVKSADGKLSFTTEADGAYSFTVAAGTYELTASKTGYASGTKTVVVTDADMTEQDITVTLLPKVSGTVTDGENPIQGAVVAMTSGTGTDARTVTTATNTQGAYEFIGVPDGSYTLSVSAVGYSDATKDITVSGADVAVEAIVLTADMTGILTLKGDGMDVLVDETFPRVIQYRLKDGLGTMDGQKDEIDTININGTAATLGTITSQLSADEKTITYTIPMTAPVNVIMTARLTVDIKDLNDQDSASAGRTLGFYIDEVEYLDNDRLTNPVKNIEIPNHCLVSVNSTQKGAKVTGGVANGNNSVKTNDVTFEADRNRALNWTGAYFAAFISNNSLAAGITSNSSLNGGLAATSNAVNRVTFVSDGSNVTIGLSSVAWPYDYLLADSNPGGLDHTTDLTAEQKVIDPALREQPFVKVVIAPDQNKDNKVDWQDGAIALRETVMHIPNNSESIKDRVNTRIALNFGSQAQNPFLTSLDNAKRVALNTDGLGQAILLKGYANEGHDSGHPDYWDIGTRMGGQTDFETMLTEGKEIGAYFGIHVNAGELYAEAKALTNKIIYYRANGTVKWGWHWHDTAISFKTLYDYGTGARQSRFQQLYDNGGKDLEFIYVDIWGNATGGTDDSWQTRQLANEITRVVGDDSDHRWRIAHEWAWANPYDSTFQHWTTDFTYGDYTNKGALNSAVIRFLLNEYKDSFPADFASYGGACNAPLLGGPAMQGFEGWQGDGEYDLSIYNTFNQMVPTKFLQHYGITSWTTAEAAVAMPYNAGGAGGSRSNSTVTQWKPEVQVKLSDGTDEIVVTRGTTGELKTDFGMDTVDKFLEGEAEYRSRVITLNDKVILKGAPASAGEDNTFPAAKATLEYLIPWYWTADGQQVTADNEKLYYWNGNSDADSSSAWDLPNGWTNLSTVVLYELSDQGRGAAVTVPVSNGKVTFSNIKANTPYVVVKGAQGASAPVISYTAAGQHVEDPSFNDARLSAWTIGGTGIATKFDSVNGISVMRQVGEVSVSQTLTEMKPNTKYLAYVAVENKSDAKAYMTVTDAEDNVLGTNYTERSIAINYISGNSLNNNHGVEPGGSRMQNMYVFFTTPASGDVTLTLGREDGTGNVYFDSLRVIETEMAGYTYDADGNINGLTEDFEHSAQGEWPFVVGPIDGVQDNMQHLSEKHDPFTQSGWNIREVDDVLDGNWSLKVHGETGNGRLAYQTIPQNFRFEPGKTYTVSFDYQMGCEDLMQVVIGDGAWTSVRDCQTIPLEMAKGKGFKGYPAGTETITNSDGSTTQVSYDAFPAGTGSKTCTFTVIGSESGQTWFGIATAGGSANNYGMPDKDGYGLYFSGRMDFILDNLTITQSDIDMSELNALVVTGASMEFESYTTADGYNGTEQEAWTAFESALEAAQTVLADMDTTQDDVDQAVAALTAAMANLKKVEVVISGTITGVNDAPVAGATVTLEDSTYRPVGLTATTDAQGKFEFRSTGDVELSVASYKLKVQATGYLVDTEAATAITKANPVSETTIALVAEAPGAYVNDFNDGDVSMMGALADSDDIPTWEAVTYNGSGALKVTFHSTAGETRGINNVVDKSIQIKNGTVSFDVTGLTNTLRLGITLRAQDPNTRIFVGQEDAVAKWFWEWWNEGNSSYESPTVKEIGVYPGETRRVRVELNEQNVQIFIDGIQIYNSTMTGAPDEAGYVGINMRNNAGTSYILDNLRIVSTDAPTANSYTVSGTVKVGNDALSGAAVSILNANDELVTGTTTNAAGQYKTQPLEPGDYTVRVTAPNYSTETASITIVDASITDKDFTLTVDKSALEALYNEKKDLDNDDKTYTDESFAALTAALEAAKSVIDDADATADEIGAAHIALQEAVAGLALRPTDFSELRTVYNTAVAYNGLDYTPDSFAALQTAIANAADILYNNPDATQAEVNEQVTALREAISGLVDKTPVTGVTLDQNSATVAVGESVTLTATVEPSNATYKDLTWTSDAESVATVVNGVVTGVSAGTATITVTTVEGNFTATCEITVTQPTTYTVTFNSNGGSTVDAQTVVENGKVSKPADPTKAGHIFGGWYKDEALTEAYDFEAPVTANITLYAKWTEVPAGSFAVTFNSNGGSAVDTQIVAEGGKATKPADPTKSGFVFSGWYTDAAFTTEYDFNTAVTADITLYAKWTEVSADSFIVTFNSNGGSAVGAQTVAEGGKVAKPADPTRDGYTFDGWYTDEALTEAYDFNAPVTANITLYAKWTEEAVNPPAPPAPPTPPTTTETKDNEDGTTTTIVTDNRTGTVTETTEKADGTVEVVETKKDGTVTETTTDPEGGKVEKVTNPDKDVAITVTSKDGEVLAEVEIPAEIPASETRFTDVPEGHWADEAIHNMAALEVVNGIGNDRYDMNGNMTRGALATVLSRLSNGQEGLDSSFADVASDVWYADGIAWAAKTGVVTGYSETEFGPNDPITREQLAVMLCRYARLLGIDTTADTASLNGFNDGSSTHDWAADSIAWCVANGILQGKGNATLAPTATATRAEVAVMLQRFIDLMK